MQQAGERAEEFIGPTSRFEIVRDKIRPVSGPPEDRDALSG